MIMRAAERLAFIDGWRAVAILLVFADHLGMNKEIGAFYEQSAIGVVSQYGETGVFIFFFISGYVVSLTALREVAATGGFSAPAFYARRFFRIAPPLTLYLGALAALGLAGLIDVSAENIVSAALYLCNSTAPGASCNWYVGHTWSLAFEEQFYCLFPLAFAWSALGKAPRPALAAAALAFAALPFVFTVWWIGKIGCVVAYGLFSAGWAAAKQGGAIEALFQNWRTPALALAALIVFAPRSVVAAFGADEAARAELIAWYRLAYVGAIPVLVLLSGAAGGVLRKLLSIGVVGALGRASYSVYLWQQLCNGPIFSDLGAAEQVALLAGTILFCLGLFRIELRVIGLGQALSRRFQRREDAEAAPSAVAIGPAH
ncbi:acyltransferase [Methylocystis echinoides]|uniref:acyltransferase family protein n=1 Tax=Methylocystis echinoides TaxID=29468 RepID=UPI00341BDE7F